MKTETAVPDFLASLYKLMKAPFSNSLLPLLLLTLCLGVAGCASKPPVSPKPASYDVALEAEARQLQTQDDLTLFGQWWVPPEGEEVRGAILLVHGTLVHSGFYAQWARYLNQEGYAVFGLDLRGFGQSQGFGRRGYIKNFDQYLLDIDVAMKEVKSRFPDKPVFMQGESLGGLVVLYAEIKGRAPVDGIVLNAPSVKLAPKVGLMRTPEWLADYSLWLASFPGKVFSNQPLLVPGRVTEMFAGVAVENNDLAKKLRNDEHVVHKALPMGFVSALQKATAEVEFNMRYVHRPLLVLHGTKDVLVPVSSSEYTVKEAASRDKTLKVYDGLSHATLLDKGHIKVWFDITDWLNNRTEAESSSATAMATQ